MRKERSAFEGWIPKEQAAKMTGLGVRTLERMAQRGEIRQAYKPVPKRRDLPVFDPKDIARIAKANGPILPHPAGAIVPRIIRNLPAHRPAAGLTYAPDAVPITVKFFLRLQEAAALSGLPVGYLKKLIASGELRARKAGGWRIKRLDLARL
jgi:excisionase family DNA binding protein